MSEEYHFRYEGVGSPLAESIAREAGLRTTGLAREAAAGLFEVVALATEATARAARTVYQASEEELRLAGDAMVDTLGRLATDPGLPLVRLALEAVEPGLLGRLSHGGTEDVAEATEALARGLTAVASRLTPAYHRAQVSAVRAALGDCGYHNLTERVTPDGRVLILAPGLDRTAVHVELQPLRGQLAFDLSGFHGRGCDAAGRRLIRALQDRGFPLRQVAHRLHGDPEGGVLARKVASAALPDGGGAHQARSRLTATPLRRADR